MVLKINHVNKTTISSFSLMLFKIIITKEKILVDFQTIMFLMILILKGEIYE